LLLHFFTNALPKFVVNPQIKEENDMKSKSKSKLIAGSLLVSALFAGIGMSPAIAQSTHTPAIDRAQQDIGALIQQGLASRHISPSEAQYLYRREREIQIRENRFKSDGSARASAIAAGSGCPSGRSGI
jgi:hypothetical protein